MSASNTCTACGKRPRRSRRQRYCSTCHAEAQKLYRNRHMTVPTPEYAKELQRKERGLFDQ